jgi:hypothetical protein
MRRRAIAIAAFAIAVTAAPPASAGVWMSKASARAVAVEVSDEACRAVGWCREAEVVPARRCRRTADRTVYCRIAFLTAAGTRCGGVVGVSKARGGRVDPGMAVPQQCS